MSYTGSTPHIDSIISSGDTLANVTARTREAGTLVYATDTKLFYYDDGTSLSPSTTGFDVIDTKANLDALPRVQGKLYYASDEDKGYTDDGAALNELGSGAGGGGIPLMALGSLLTSNGVDNGELDVGADGEILVANSAAANGAGVEWQAPSGGGFAEAQASVFTNRVTPNLNWQSVSFGGGIFVATATTGVGNRVMTSVDGVTWTGGTCPDAPWYSSTYGIGPAIPGGLFVAVGAFPASVMTSPDGLAWTSQTPVGTGNYFGVAYGAGLFVAISNSGETGSQSIMHSPDGVTWTLANEANANDWIDIKWVEDLTLFVAVANSGAVAGQRVMTSPDGIAWTSQSGILDILWNHITYGAGLIVIVGNGGNIMTSPDGITWTSRLDPAFAGLNFRGAEYGGGVFILPSSGTVLATSVDGIYWSKGTAGSNSNWQEIAYGNGIFAAVANTSGGVATERVMTSRKLE